jgi:AcrR family transcriptional regulator
MSVPSTRPQQSSPSIDWGDPRGHRYGNAEIVAITGVPSSSIHHYLRLGLIPRPERTAADSFVYDDRHVVGLAIIRRLRQRGRTLDDVRQALPELLATDIDQLDTDLADYLTRQADLPHPRARLIDAAIGAFAQQGYAEVTVTGVCSRAQVAKGTFYRYFDNKDELFLATAATIVERAVAGFAADVGAGVASNDAVQFASHLRGGLPVLFELAKCSLQASGPNAQVAVALFVDLVERLGQVISQDATAAVRAQQGGVVVMFAVVEIFARLLDIELSHARPSTA